MHWQWRESAVAAIARDLQALIPTGTIKAIGKCSPLPIMQCANHEVSCCLPSLFLRTLLACHVVVPFRLVCCICTCSFFVRAANASHPRRGRRPWGNRHRRRRRALRATGRRQPQAVTQWPIQLPQPNADSCFLALLATMHRF